VSDRRRNRGSLFQRADYLRGLGQILAAAALLLQLAVPNLHRPLLLTFQNSADDLNGAYDEHAVCRAQRGADPTPGSPADQVPRPIHHDLAACCFWHGSAGFALAPAEAIESITFERSVVNFSPLLDNVRTLLPATVRARGPPVRV